MLDIRIPIGLLFTVLGILLGLYGLMTSGDTELYKKSFEMNVNIWSGVGMLVFGLIMLMLARMGKKNPDKV